MENYHDPTRARDALLALCQYSTRIVHRPLCGQETHESDTCYHSYPRAEGELGRSKPVVQTSNRRFRDDEFLIPRKLTQGLSAIRVRIEFTPVNIPLLPNLPVDEQAWSEIRYQAYCCIMPEFDRGVE